jgi:hypothetical protein
MPLATATAATTVVYTEEELMGMDLQPFMELAEKIIGYTEVYRLEQEHDKARRAIVKEILARQNAP